MGNHRAGNWRRLANGILNNNLKGDEMKKITLHTRLNSGIYESHGGGQDRIIESWNIGPMNLLKALDSLHEERQ